MLNKLLNKKVFIIATAVIALSFVGAAAVKASQPRNCDGNAILYCGAYSVSELNNKINSGTGQPNQSSADLKDLYNTMNMGQKYFGKLENGYVYRDGHVTVNGRTVATGVETAGRHFIPGSRKDSRFTYPVYWREPSISFNSDKLEAFVYINDSDGKMAFGIMKSCGNPIRGEGVITLPVVTPTFSLTVKKFEDIDGDKIKDTNEKLLSNWTFKVKGKNVDKSITTNSNGVATVSGLVAGDYTVDEINKAGWSSTTGLHRSIHLTKNSEIMFGNRKIPVTPSSTFNIKARKFEDVNGNGKHDENEAWLSNWDIKLSGNNLNREFLTDGNGTVNFSNLPAGTYMVSEVMKTGWKNITPISRTVTLPDPNNLEGYVEFGNQKITIPVTPQGTVEATPASLPTAGPAEAIMGTLGGVSLAGAGAYFRKGRKLLKAAHKNVK